MANSWADEEAQRLPAVLNPGPGAQGKHSRQNWNCCLRGSYTLNKQRQPLSQESEKKNCTLRHPFADGGKYCILPREICRSRWRELHDRGRKRAGASRILKRPARVGARAGSIRDRKGRLLRTRPGAGRAYSTARRFARFRTMADMDSSRRFTGTDTWRSRFGLLQAEACSGLRWGVETARRTLASCGVEAQRKSWNGKMHGFRLAQFLRLITDILLTSRLARTATAF